MRRLNDFICWAGGADLDILAQCPEERSKFQALGLGVLVTCTMAFISMGFALFSLYSEPFSGRKFILPLFMVFWSIVIFSIDWGLIKTMHKKAEMSRNEWVKYILGITFRFLVAAVISFTISKPLEVKIFESELKPEVQNNKDLLFLEQENKIKDVLRRDSSSLATVRQDVTEALRQGAAAPADPSYESLGTEITSLEVRIAGLRTQISNIQSQINEISNDPRNVEIVEGRSILTNTAYANKEALKERKRNIGEQLGLIKREKDEKDKQRQEILTRHKEQANISLEAAKKRQLAADTVASNNTKMINDKRAELNNVTSEYKPNLITYIKAMSTLEAKSDGEFVFYVRWLIFFLILMVDTAPIIIKVLFKRGSYEEIVERIEYERMAHQSVLRFTAMKEREVNKILINDVSISQNEIIRSALNSFQEDETRNMQQNFRSYFRTGSIQQNQNNPRTSVNTESNSNARQNQEPADTNAQGSITSNNESQNPVSEVNRDNDRFVVPPRPSNNNDLNNESNG